MTTKSVVRAIRKWWWAVLALTVAGGFIGALLSVVLPPVWQSTTEIVVAYDAPADAATGSAGLSSANTFAVQKVFAYQEIVLSPRVLGQVIEDLGLDKTVEELALDVAVTVPLNTPVMEIAASAPNPQDAATLSTAIADEFTEVVTELETPTNGVSAVRLETLLEATPPIEPLFPNVFINVAIGLFAGFAAGVIWIAVAASSDRRIYNAGSLDGGGDDVPGVLGSVPALAGSSSATALVDKPLSRVSEAYRTIAATLGHVPGAQLGIIAIASAVPRDKTSALTSNVAFAMQEFGVRCVLVDANLRSGTISSSLGLVGPGLTDCLRGDIPLAQALTSVRGLAVLPSGSTTDSPAELMSGTKFEKIVKSLKADFDMVIMDAAPALPLSDTLFAASVADSVVLAISAGRVTSAELTAAADALTAVNVKVVGVVLVNAPVNGVDADAATSQYRQLKPANA